MDPSFDPIADPASGPFNDHQPPQDHPQPAAASSSTAPPHTDPEPQTDPASVAARAFPAAPTTTSTAPFSLTQLSLLPNETFFGQIQSLSDAYLLYTTCVQLSLLPLLRRRLHPDELKLIRSGSVYLYEEEESGIQRWTDRIAWGPSKIVGHFLEYREVVGKVGGRQKNAILQRYLADHPEELKVEDDDDEPMTSPARGDDGDVGVKTEMYFDMEGLPPGPIQSNASRKMTAAVLYSLPVAKRALVSSVLDSKYKGLFIFKRDGLVKRSITLTFDPDPSIAEAGNGTASAGKPGGRYHVVCYFHVIDLQWLAKLGDFAEVEGVVPPAGLCSVVSKWKTNRADTAASAHAASPGPSTPTRGGRPATGGKKRTATATGSDGDPHSREGTPLKRPYLPPPPTETRTPTADALYNPLTWEGPGSSLPSIHGVLGMHTGPRHHRGCQCRECQHVWASAGGHQEWGFPRGDRYDAFAHGSHAHAASSSSVLLPRPTAQAEAGPSTRAPTTSAAPTVSHHASAVSAGTGDPVRPQITTAPILPSNRHGQAPVRSAPTSRSTTLLLHTPTPDQRHIPSPARFYQTSTDPATYGRPLLYGEPDQLGARPVPPRMRTHSWHSYQEPVGAGRQLYHTPARRYYEYGRTHETMTLAELMADDMHQARSGPRPGRQDRAMTSAEAANAAANIMQLGQMGSREAGTSGAAEAGQAEVRSSGAAEGGRAVGLPASASASASAPVRGRQSSFERALDALDTQSDGQMEPDDKKGEGS